MSFVLYHTPFDSISPDITPIYNGLPYTLRTTQQWYERPGFKYVADVYVDGGSTRVSRLKHDADKNTNVGVFDFGRLIENWVYNEAPTNNSTTSNYSNKENSVIPYEIKWGMEMDRYDSITIWVSYYSSARFFTESSAHNLRVGDYAVVRGSSQTGYNGAFRVMNTTTSTVMLDCPYLGNPTEKGEFIEAEGFSDNYYWVDNGREYAGFIIPLSRPTEIQEGDTVTIIQDVGATNPSYDGEWYVMGVQNVIVGSSTYQLIKTNCPWVGSTPANSGAIYVTNRKRINEDLLTSSGKVFNGVLQYDEYLDWNPSDYIMDSTGKFLTNLPGLNMIKGLHSNTNNTRMLYTPEDSYLTLTTFNGSALGNDTINQVSYEYFDENNNYITGETISISVSSQEMLDLGVGPKNKQVFSPLPTNTKYYTVVLRDTGAIISEKITIYIRDCDTKYTNKRIKYLNRLGGWDYFDFNLRSDETIDVDRSQFRRNLRELNSSNDYTYKMGDRGNTTYNVNASRTELVRTNWLKTHEASVLEELWTSPQVYLLKDDPKGYPRQYPINITTSSLDKGKGENFGLIRYEIEYQYSNNIFTQRL